MTGLEIWLLAIGLAMDCFAVFILSAVLYWNVFGCVRCLIMALAFGFFQALMPLLGWIGASFFSHLIENIDHWIAFCYSGFSWRAYGLGIFQRWRLQTWIWPYQPKSGFGISGSHQYRRLAVGISFAVIHVNIFTACLLICGITFGLSLIGAAMGKRFGSMVKEKARVLGGVILILIGLRIFVEHMFF